MAEAYAYRGPRRYGEAAPSGRGGNLALGVGVAAALIGGAGLLYVLSQQKKPLTCDPGYHVVGDHCEKDAGPGPGPASCAVVPPCAMGYHEDPVSHCCVPDVGVAPSQLPLNIDKSFGDLDVAEVNLPGRYRVDLMTGTLTALVKATDCFGKCFCPNIADSYVDVYLVDTVAMKSLKVGNIDFSTTPSNEVRSREFQFSPNFVANRIRFEAAPGCRTYIVGSWVYTPLMEHVGGQLLVEVLN